MGSEKIVVRTPPLAGTLTCPNCAAPASRDDSSCRYCRSALAQASCGSCFGLLFDGAAFCGHCGSPRDRVETREAWHAPCPACKGEMTWVRVGNADLLECGGCEGTWMEAQTFERLCADQESRATLLHAPVRDPRTPPDAGPAFRYRPCPLCAKLMNRVNFGRASGAVVDVCKGHGTFLDRGELHQIVRFIQGGGLDRLRATEREQIVEERRRLEDAGRLDAKIFSDRSNSTLNDTRVARLLLALLGW